VAEKPEQGRGGKAFEVVPDSGHDRR
jgi:hypothetical protein